MGSAVFFPNLLDPKEFELIEFREGETFSEFAARTEVGELMTRQPIVPALNGAPLLEADWDTELSESDVLSLQAAPQYEGAAYLICGCDRDWETR